MKKKFLTLSIIFILMITIVGCSNPGGETKNQYTIVYDSQGGTYISSSYSYEGLKLIKPIDPIKEGYTFLGWYNNDILWDFENNIVNSDIVLIAKWEENIVEVKTYYISLDPVGGKLNELYIEFTDCNNVDLPIPTKDGYNFLGWYEDDRLIEKLYENKNYTLVAKWETVLSCAEDRTQEKCLDPDTFDWNYNRFEFDGKGMEIKLYVDYPDENNPFSSGFTGERVNERQVVQTKVENEYNVKIAWTEYPALWGPSRVAWIEDQKNSEIEQGKIFQIDSAWIPELVSSKSIIELYNTNDQTGLFKEFGYAQSDIANEVTSINNIVYGYVTEKIRPDMFLYYNQNLVDELDLEDPATLWNEGKWDYAKFTEFADAAMEAFGPDSGKTVLAGDVVRMSQGFLAAAGGKYIDGDLNKVLLSDPKTVRVWENLRALYAKGQIERSYLMADVSDNFIAGNTIFNTGSLWFLSSSSGFNVENKVFDISVVPYPTAEGDGNERKNYLVPVASWSTYVIGSCENGNSSKIIFNILNDLFNSLPPIDFITSYSEDELYRNSLRKTGISSQSINAIMSVQDGMHEGPSYLYLDLLELVSMTAGEGSHFGYNGFWMNCPIIRGEEEPSVALNKLQPIYEKILEEILNGNYYSEN